MVPSQSLGPQAQHSPLHSVRDLSLCFSRRTGSGHTPAEFNSSPLGGGILASKAVAGQQTSSGAKFKAVRDRAQNPVRKGNPAKRWGVFLPPSAPGGHARLRVDSGLKEPPPNPKETGSWQRQWTPGTPHFRAPGQGDFSVPMIAFRERDCSILAG